MAQNLRARIYPYVLVGISELLMVEHTTPKRRELLSRQIRFVRRAFELLKVLQVGLIIPAFGSDISLKWLGLLIQLDLFRFQKG
jgi:hypothetical protein